MVDKTLKFFNSIQLHYGKLNSVNERDIQLFDEEALIKLSIEHGSVEKIFESLILKYEKGVDINEEYINKVLNKLIHYLINSNNPKNQAFQKRHF